MPHKLAMIAILAAGKAAASQNCFWRSNNQINAMTSPEWFACNNTQVMPGGAQLCCIQGSQCGQDSICLQNVSYYVGGCTDGSYGDPVCRTSCTSDKQTWIQWNPNTSVWECCGSNGCDGSAPSETFSAVARASWSPVKTAAQSTTTATTSPSTSHLSQTNSLGVITGVSSIATSHNTHTGSPNPNDGTGLSAGAQAGIGVACGLLGLAAVLAIGLLLIRRHKKRRVAAAQGQEDSHQEPESAGSIPPAAHKYAPLDESSSVPYHEFTPQPKPELSADTTARVELDGHAEENPK